LGGANRALANAPQNAQTEEVRKEIDLALAHADLLDGQKELGKGSFAEADRVFQEALSIKDITDQDRADALEGKCEAEHQAGEPTFSLQYEVKACREAASAVNNRSSQIAAAIVSQLKAHYTQTISKALNEKDTKTAQAYVQEYADSFRTEQALVDRWNKQIASIESEKAAEATRVEEKRIQGAIARLSKRYRDVSHLSSDEFTDFLVKSYQNGYGAAFFSDAKIENEMLTLTVPSPDVRGLIDSQAVLDQINDYFVAWCKCDGKTRVVGEYFGRMIALPIRVRLDPEQEHSVLRLRE